MKMTRDIPLASAQVLLPVSGLCKPACCSEPLGAGNVILSSCTFLPKHFSELCYGKRQTENKESVLIRLGCWVLGGRKKGVLQWVFVFVVFCFVFL